MLEDVLVRQQIPYQVIGGPRFYERAEIKDAVAYLSILHNPNDAVSLLRIANRPRRGIGDTSLQRLVTHADAMGISLFEAMADPEAAGLGTAAVKAVRGFHTTMLSLQSASQELELDELVEAVLARSGTREALEAERTIEARGRIENLEELVGVAREFRAEREEPTLASFLQEISLVSDQDALADRESLVTLMTIHNAKGLEFRAVFLIGMEEGIFPHSRSIEDNEIEEERRLAYVGMTRAMEKLTLTHAMARSLYGRREYNLASRFLDELPDAVERERLQPSSWSSYGSERQLRASAGPAARAHGDPVAADRRLRAARLAGRGRRHPHRARRPRHRPLRERRQRAQADARVRAAREDRLMAIRIRTTRNQEEYDRALHGIGHYFGGGWTPEEKERFAKLLPHERHARRIRRRRDHRRRGRFSLRADDPRRTPPVRRGDRGRRSADAQAAGDPRPDDARAARRHPRARRAAGCALGLGGDDLRALRLRARLAGRDGAGDAPPRRAAARSSTPGWERAARGPRRGACGLPAHLRPRSAQDARLHVALARLVGAAEAGRPPEGRRGAGELNRLLLELDGRPAGYALYRIKFEFDDAANVSKVRVNEAIGDSPAATRELWRYLLAIDWVHEIEAHLLPPDHPLFLLVQRPNRLNWKVFDGLWLRLVDVGAALSARSLAADGRITFDISTDPMFPENAGTWTLEAGSAVRSRRRPDLRLDVQALASAYLGGFTFADLARAGRIEETARGGHRPGRRALPRRREALVPRDLLARPTFSRQSQLALLAERGRSVAPRSVTFSTGSATGWARTRWSSASYTIASRATRWQLLPPRNSARLGRSGRLAQLGEHQLDKLGVTGSSPVAPTTKSPANAGLLFTGVVTPRACVGTEWEHPRPPGVPPGAPLADPGMHPCPWLALYGAAGTVPLPVVPRRRDLHCRRGLGRVGPSDDDHALRPASTIRTAAVQVAAVEPAAVAARLVLVVLWSAFEQNEGGAVPRAPHVLSSR